MLASEPHHDKPKSVTPKADKPGAIATEEPKKHVQIPAEKLGASYQHIIPTVRETKEPVSRSVSGSPVLGEAANARPVGVTSSIPIHKLPAKKRYLRLLRDQKFVSLLSSQTGSNGASGSGVATAVQRSSHGNSSSSSCASSVDQGNHSTGTANAEEVTKRLEVCPPPQVTPSEPCHPKLKPDEMDTESPDVDILGTSPNQSTTQQARARPQGNAPTLSSKQKSPSTSSSSVSSADELVSNTGSTSGAVSADSTTGSSPSLPSSQQVSPNSTSSAFSDNSLNSQKQRAPAVTAAPPVRPVPHQQAKPMLTVARSPPQTSPKMLNMPVVTTPLTVNTSQTIGHTTRAPLLSAAGQGHSRGSPYLRVSPKTVAKSPGQCVNSLMATKPSPRELPVTQSSSILSRHSTTPSPAASAASTSAQISPLMLQQAVLQSQQILQSNSPQVNHTQLAATAVADMQAQAMLNAMYAQEQRRQQQQHQQQQALQQQAQQMAAISVLQGGTMPQITAQQLQNLALAQKFQAPTQHTSKSSSIYFPHIPHHPYSFNNMNINSVHQLLLNPENSKSVKSSLASPVVPPAAQSVHKSPPRLPSTPVPQLQSQHQVKRPATAPTIPEAQGTPQATPLTNLTVPQIRSSVHRVPSADADNASSKFAKPLDPQRPWSPPRSKAHPMEALTELTNKQPIKINSTLCPPPSIVPKKEWKAESPMQQRRGSTSSATQTTPKKQTVHSSQTARSCETSPTPPRQPIPKVKIHLDKPGSDCGSSVSGDSTVGLEKTSSVPRKKHQKKTKEDLLRAELKSFKAERKAAAAERERADAGSPELTTGLPVAPVGDVSKVNKRKSAPAPAVLEEKEKPQPTNKRRRRHNSCNVSDKDANKITGIKKVVTTEHGVDYQIEPDDDSYNSITCFCRQPFNGRLMVECEHCGIWYHADCVGLSQTTIPEVFICTRKKKCMRKKQQASAK